MKALVGTAIGIRFS